MNSSRFAIGIFAAVALGGAIAADAQEPSGTWISCELSSPMWSKDDRQIFLVSSDNFYSLSPYDFSLDSKCEFIPSSSGGITQTCEISTEEIKAISSFDERRFVITINRLTGTYRRAAYWNGRYVEDDVTGTCESIPEPNRKPKF